MKKTLITILIVVLLLGGGVVTMMILSGMRKQPEKQERKVPAPPVEVVEARSEPVTFEVDTQGTVQPRTTTVLVPQVSGVIAEISPAFHVGGLFEEGEVLVRIDDRDYQAAVADARANLAQAELNLAEEQARADRAVAEWRKLGNTGEPTALTARKPQLARAEAAIESARAALDRAERDVERTEIRAPYKGIVREKSADIGQNVGPGNPLGTVFAVDYVEVPLPVTAEDLAYLNVPLSARPEADVPTPPVTFSANIAGKTHTWQGEVVRTEGAFDPDSRMLNLIGRVADPYATEPGSNHPPLIVGMFTEAAVQGVQLPEAFVLPRQVLRNNDQVLVVDPENRVRIRDVEIARIDRRQVYITGGLKDGERVCLTPLEYVVEGMPVNPIQEEPDDKEISSDSAVRAKSLSSTEQS